VTTLRPDARHFQCWRERRQYWIHLADSQRRPVAPPVHWQHCNKKYF